MHLILLAAGRSSRMGHPKGLVLVLGMPWLEVQMTLWRAAGGMSATIVLGDDAGEYFDRIPALRQAQNKAINWCGITTSVVINHQVDRGPYHSLMQGLSHALQTEPPIPYFYLSPLDVPMPGAILAQSLADAMAQSGISAASPSINHRMGHPIVISRPLALSWTAHGTKDGKAEAVQRLDSQIKGLTDAEKSFVLTEDPTCRMNLNAPEDIRLFENALKSALAREFTHRQTAEYAALLSLTEIGLGSALHSLRVPLAGQALSLNQIFLLSLAQRRTPMAFRAADQPVRISIVTSILKSLSPAGKRLEPMLAISMQGLLFALGCRLGGRRLLGSLLGGIVAGLWAYLQPLMLYLIIFGKTLIDAGAYFIDKLTELTPVTQDTLIVVLSIVISIKLLASATVVLLSQFLPEATIDQYLARLAQRARLAPRPMDQKPQNRPPWQLALRDMTRPWFVLSIVLTAVFFGLANAPASQAVWALLRPLAIGYIFFYGIHSLSPLRRQRLLDLLPTQVRETLVLASSFLRR